MITLYKKGEAITCDAKQVDVLIKAGYSRSKTKPVEKPTIAKPATTKAVAK